MMGKITDYQAIILAGLLHDIGKFYQRSGAKFDHTNQTDQHDYTNFSRKNRDGHYSHLHGAFTAKFFRENLDQYDEVGVIAALHHVPEQGNNERQKFLARLIALADRMSSGERQEREEEEESGRPKEEPLTSIFSQLELEDSDIEREKKSRPAYYIPLSPLQESLAKLFPVEDKKNAFHNLTGEDAYKKMWGEFIGDLKKLNSEDYDLFLAQIYHLLLKYTLSIPSAVYRDRPDISLFHHLKTTAALAGCLYKLSEEEGDGFGEKVNRILAEIKTIGQEAKNEASGIKDDKEDKDLDRQDFLLVGGDISGIQDFIYQVTSEKALKGLRARSFYLQLLSEIVARKVLGEFDIKEVNLLYCGGGNFYLLLPNLKVAVSKLNSIQSELDEVLIRAHKGKIATILSWVPVSYRDFFQNFAALWEKLGKELSTSKKRKFSALITSGGREHFKNFVLGPFDQGGETKGCNICGEEIEQSRDICSLCESLISFSEDLVRARAISIVPETRKTLPDKDLRWPDVFQALGFKCEFLFSVDGKNGQGKIIINSTDFAGRFDGFTFMAKKVPALNGQTLTLEDIAEKASGIKKWGVLRADVDNLGKLFQQGLGKNKTISRISMLSSMLSLYFSARISQLQKWTADSSGNEGLADFVYVAYSGGDDLFLIGPWSVLPDLAKAIYDDFRKFTCERLTLSTGIFFAPGKKFPIYQAAKMAGEAEDKAKDDGRNRLNLFGESMAWECFPKVKKIIELVTSLVDENNGRGVPRSLLGILYNIYQEKEKKKKQEISMERVWRLHYSLKKLMRKLDEKTQADIQKLFELIITDYEYEVYPYLNIATRVADYLTRK
jgi:CRISPR-associated protein Csm1